MAFKATYKKIYIPCCAGHWSKGESCRRRTPPVKSPRLTFDLNHFLVLLGRLKRPHWQWGGR